MISVAWKARGHRCLRALLISLIFLVGSGCEVQLSSGPPATPTPGRLAPAMVQVENAPGSRPQWGLQQADVVYEYLTEGGISRFTVLYWNPSGGFRIEPVRSARLVTLRLLEAYGGVLFYSGASNVVQAKIEAGHLPAVGQSTDRGRHFSRDRSRPAPHNLLTTGDQLRRALEKLQVRVSYPVPAPTEPAGSGEQVNKLSFPQTFIHTVSYTYSASDRAYFYADERGPLVDAGAGAKQVAVTNVVLLRVAHHGAGYTEDVLGAEGIDFDLASTGNADVYSRGKHFAARWDLSRGPLRLVGTDKKLLPLPGGLTWVHLVDLTALVQTV